ncbi:hypothetical protein CPC735_017820 [Coccidioides posadasii C735 delta SOWgp]|uniref:Uncharacterized protein n=1 Tax=Coccidioides posadasii (strain C735) TaxID=222929 RepID=C5PDL8_COCP7|nr:hypothetical protein CPC735_017820 [Coccidioides posadasii C735 delta SOWgp]EER25179.1 hypothetical protein CPC735_017820 [Coccidioides posadasii C735 delta SOWgp]|eukprot:XP_003067324.1 hypothetical protein CPC735_017820 [Coccidioides posadasii C735 delta SOWgp]
MPSTDSKPINSKPATKLDEIYRVKTLSDASSEPAEHPLSDLTSSTDLALAYLCTTTKLEELHTSLLHSLSAAGWTERVRSLAFELLRSGRCTRFDELLDKVVHLATSPKPTTGYSPSPSPASPSSSSPTTSSSSSSSILGKRKRDKGPNGTTSATNGIPPLKKENTSDAEGSKGEEDHPDETEDSHEQTANGTTTTAETADPNGKHKSPSDDDDDDDDNSNSKTAFKEEKKKKAKKKKKKEKKNDDDDDDDDDELYLLAEFDVRIPSHIVGRGVKFLHEAIDEIFTKAPKGQDEDGGAEPAPRAAAETHHDDDDDDEEMANPKVKIAKKR